MVLDVVLMIVFGGIEFGQRSDLRDDFLGVDFGGVELGDVGFSNFFLFGTGVEDGGAVLRTPVRTLLIEFRRIMSYGEEDHQNLAVGDLGRIEDDADTFGMPGAAGTDRFVVRGIGGAAGVTGGGGKHAASMLEDGLHAPEAAAGENGDLLTTRGGDGIVHGGLRESAVGTRRSRSQRGGGQKDEEKTNSGIGIR